MKQTLKSFIASVLGWQVRRLSRKNKIRVVAVVGSIGKTSTKIAIAKLLSQQYRVCYQDGNYNDIVTAPLVFFNRTLPSLLNPFAWLRTIIGIELQLHRPYPYDIVVLELGTDGPGQMIRFKKYLRVDLLVVTAIAPEHMEFFSSLDAVAAEELAAQEYSKNILINKDLCAPQYTEQIKRSYMTYSTKSPADYDLVVNQRTGGHYDLSVVSHGNTVVAATYKGISDVELYSVCAATAVAHRFSVSASHMAAGIGKLTAFNGRMKQLRGANQSVIIDDTYNSGPVAAKAALDSLYKLRAPQKIALLGNMNELGDYSGQAHTEVGEYCSPKELDLVVTIGKDANRYLAAAAEKRGCKVKTFDNPYDAGIFIKDVVKPNAVILAKGSQNGVYAEEAVKLFLDNPKDAKHLVRQSPEWMSKKRWNLAG